MEENFCYLQAEDGVRLAYEFSPGTAPTVVFLSGFASHMGGTKAMHLQQWCRDHGRAYLRLDYRGHGKSDGEFEAGTVGVWAADALTVLRAATRGPVLLIGSSMGAWIMLLVARELGEQVCAMIGLASAPDFTEELIHAHLDAKQRAQLNRDGRLERASNYDQGPNVVTLRMIEQGRHCLQLQEIIPLRCPVRLIHGLADPDVPWEISLRLCDRLEAEDVLVTLVKDAGHRLSASRELRLLTDTLRCLLSSIEEH
ncbi:MAG: pimeloyl-ACP methyl ester carboxylesterase [Gammaproteobacteria bacterium]|jgi:pimeloyl-ACP methyl ester carboxylesterase